GLLRHLRIAIYIIYIEGGELPVVAARQFDLDVLAHVLDQIVRALVFSLLSVETERVNDAEKSGAAQDLLRDAVQLMLNVVIDVRDNIFLRHGRLLNQNERARPVGRWDQPARSPHEHPAAKKRHQELPPPTADDSLHLRKIR